MPPHLKRTGGQVSEADIKKEVDNVQEVQSPLFCPLQEKFHTVVLRGAGNISDTL